MNNQVTETKTTRRVKPDPAPAPQKQNPGPSLAAQKAAESARQLYQYQPPRPQKQVELHDEDLPASYDQTRLTLMSRDPNHIHAYWEIAQQDVANMQNRLGPEFDRSSYALRLHDVTLRDFNGQNANHSFDIDIAPHMRNWYVNLWSDNTNYCGQIGMRTPSGEFYPYTQSNIAMTPRASASGRSDMMWMDVKDDRQDAFIFTWPRARRVAKALDTDQVKRIDRFAQSRRIYITEEDIRAYYLNLYPLLRRVRSFRRLVGQDEELDLDIDGQVASRIAGLANREQIEDLTIPGISKSEHYKRILCGASAELFEKVGASEQVFSPGASEYRAQQRKFFFELWTELIVYGRTEPNATVVLNGNQTVKLRPDGTFTLRYALPDGKIPLDFTAYSWDRIDKRRIATAVEREQTKYSS